MNWHGCVVLVCGLVISGCGGGDKEKDKEKGPPVDLSAMKPYTDAERRFSVNAVGEPKLVTESREGREHATFTFTAPTPDMEMVVATNELGDGLYYMSDAERQKGIREFRDELAGETGAGVVSDEAFDVGKGGFGRHYVYFSAAEGRTFHTVFAFHGTREFRLLLSHLGTDAHTAAAETIVASFSIIPEKKAELARVEDPDLGVAILGFGKPHAKRVSEPQSLVTELNYPSRGKGVRVNLTVKELLAAGTPNNRQRRATMDTLAAKLLAQWSGEVTKHDDVDVGASVPARRYSTVMPSGARADFILVVHRKAVYILSVERQDDSREQVELADRIRGSFQLFDPPGD